MSGRYHFSGHFMVWCPGEDETEDDSVRVDTSHRVRHPRHAAAQWLQKRNSEEGDYTDSGDITVVHVHDPDGDVTRWDVRAETAIEYSAREAE